MAIVSNATLWADVVGEIEKKYGRKGNSHNYFQGYVSSQDIVNPIAGLVPRHTKFFGPKVCQIFIIGRPYQEVGSGSSVSIQWPPEGYDDSKEKLKTGFKNFSKYELHFYLDLVIAKKMKEADSEAGEKFEELLRETAEHIREDCEGEMKEYGWFYEEEIEEESDIRADTFYPVLDEFYIKVNRFGDED